MAMTILQKIVDSGTPLTPMMVQYYDIKKLYPDTLLLYRMGDFYEVFFDDAIEASSILNITLTHRGKIGEFPIPMAGIPHHAANTYIDRITAIGKKAIICDQIEDPKFAKGIVKRAVTQIVSPALPYDLAKAEGHERFIAAGFRNGNDSDDYFLSCVDFTTGDFHGYALKGHEAFLEKLRLIAPKEFLAYLGQWDDLPILSDYLSSHQILPTYLSSDYFDQKYNAVYIERLIPTYKRDQLLLNVQAILNPIGALGFYVTSTQNLTTLSHIKPFRLTNENNLLKVTLPTLTGLEVLPRDRMSEELSLLGFFDQTKSAMGKRALRQLFQTPTVDLTEIKKRHAIIDFFISDDSKLHTLREELTAVRDIERIMAKVTTGKVNTGDLYNIVATFKVYESSLTLLKELYKGQIEPLTKNSFSDLKDLCAKVVKTLNDEIGASLDKGNLIKSGVSRERDHLFMLSRNSGEALLKLEERYRQETGLSKIKIKSNNVNGFFIEVSRASTEKVPANFIRRQTLVNAERYTTEELALFEKEILSANEKLSRVEKEIFLNIVEEVRGKADSIMALGKVVAHIDLFQSLAFVALTENFVKPLIEEKERVIDIKGGWHPLIKKSLRERFVPHDLILNESQFFGLITGPNMAGKTTVMREVAIIQLLTQMGSFVPARFARVSLCDYLFSRLGASDDILKGHSTFMVEMAETAEIIRHATKNSLIILDEVGRGTSTYDGLSIAWALVEHLVAKTCAFTLFATHYHELIELIDSLKEAKNLTVEVQTQGDEVHFLYRLIERPASESYGIYVAKLAGLPQTLLKRAQIILKELEEHKAHTKPESSKKREEQLPLMLELKEPVPEYLLKMESELRKIDLMNTTPIDALTKLAKIKELLK